LWCSVARKDGFATLGKGSKTLETVLCGDDFLVAEFLDEHARGEIDLRSEVDGWWGEEREMGP